MLKKFFFTLVFFIFIIFLINFNDCLASFDIYDNGEVVSLPDLPIDERISEDMYNILPYFISYNTYYSSYVFYIPRYLVDGGIVTFSKSYKSRIYYKVPGQEIFGQFYAYRVSNNKWEFISGIESYLNFIEDTILYSSQNIYSDDGASIFFNASFGFDLNFNETFNLYQVVSKSPIDYDRFDYITATITDFNNNTYNLEWEFSDLDETFYVYYYDIYENGTYTINIVDSEKDEEYTFTINCTEIDEDFGSLNLYLSTEEQTTEPIYVLSNRYYYEGEYDSSQDFLKNYNIEIAYRFR